MFSNSKEFFNSLSNEIKNVKNVNFSDMYKELISEYFKKKEILNKINKKKEEKKEEKKVNPLILEMQRRKTVAVSNPKNPIMTKKNAEPIKKNYTLDELKKMKEPDPSGFFLFLLLNFKF